MEKYKEFYEARSDGTIFSKYNDSILIPYINSMGYYTVSLSIRGEKKTILVHRYVAYLLVDGYDPNLVVNHIDGDRLNNKIENLEWVTQKENIRHAIDSGSRDYTGELHPMWGREHSEESKRKMSESRKALNITGVNHPRSTAVIQICPKTGETIAEFDTQSEAAQVTGCSRGNINSVLRGRRKTAGGFRWSYK